jgi:hypothetical protein
MQKFNVGQTYSTRSLCDWNCIFSFTILARTAKTVTVKVEGKTVSRGVKPNYDGTAEGFKPFGTYSMAPFVTADAKDLSEAVHPAYAQAEG